MLKPILSTTKNILSAIYALVFAALIGFLAWGSYQLYQNERTIRRFMEEGQLVTVQVTDVDRSNRVWYDQLTSASYVSFMHHGRRNEVRYKRDTAWIGVGDQLNVWYHPDLDAFRAPDKSIAFNNKLSYSKLIEFTILNRWTNERKLLAFTILFTGIFAILVLSGLSLLIRLPILKLLSRLLLVSMIVCTLLYLVYNTWQYYRYYSRVRSNATEITVTVLDTDKYAQSTKSRWWYRYRATIAYPKGQKTIPIEEEEYDQLKPKDRLQVLYNSELDDMMSVKYSPDHSNLVGCICLVAMGGYFIWRYFIKKGR